MARGDQVGAFRLGSSIVLVFEAPSSFSFSVKDGDRVCCGKSIGKIQQTPESAVDEFQKVDPKRWYHIFVPT